LNRSNIVIIYPFPMHLSQGFTYHLSILQSVVALARLVKINLVVLDTPEQIADILWREFRERMPENLVVSTVKNKRFGVRSNTVWFRRKLNQILINSAASNSAVVFYTRNVKLAAAFFCKKNRRPSNILYVFETHQIFSQNLASQAKFAEAKKENILEKRLFSHADVIFANTSILVRLIQRLFAVDARILPVAVRLSDVKSLNGEEQVLFNSRQFDFVYTGNFDAWKGVDLLIDALELLVSKGWAGKALLVGAKKNQIKKWVDIIALKGIERQVVLRERVSKSEVKDLLDQAKVGVIPNSLMDDSIFNTSPLKLFDYAARGLPLVISNVPALTAEVTLSDVEWFAADNVDDLARAMDKALKRFSNLSQESIDWAMEHTWDVRSSRIIATIENTIRLEAMK